MMGVQGCEVLLKEVSRIVGQTFDFVDVQSFWRMDVQLLGAYVETNTTMSP
jgi:hypothetical protein